MTIITLTNGSQVESFEYDDPTEATETVDELVAQYGPSAVTVEQVEDGWVVDETDIAMFGPLAAVATYDYPFDPEARAELEERN